MILVTSEADEVCVDLSVLTALCAARTRTRLKQGLLQLGEARDLVMEKRVCPSDI